MSTTFFQVDGMWSAWSEFGACPVTCGGGTQERTRECTNPAPEFGGADCAGDAVEGQDCGTDPCPGKNWLKFDMCNLGFSLSTLFFVNMICFTHCLVCGHMVKSLAI